VFEGDSIKPICVAHKNASLTSVEIGVEYICFGALYTENECYALEYEGGDGWTTRYYTNWETCAGFCNYVIEEYTTDSTFVNCSPS
jgi:hypothetical protein